MVEDAVSSVQARPLSALNDVSRFPAPPVHRGAHGTAFQQQQQQQQPPQQAPQYQSPEPQQYQQYQPQQYQQPPPAAAYQQPAGSTYQQQQQSPGSNYQSPAARPLLSTRTSQLSSTPAPPLPFRPDLPDPSSFPAPPMYGRPDTAKLLSPATSSLTPSPGVTTNDPQSLYSVAPIRPVTSTTTPPLPRRRSAISTPPSYDTTPSPPVSGQAGIPNFAAEIAARNSNSTSNTTSNSSGITSPASPVRLLGKKKPPPPVPPKKKTGLSAQSTGLSTRSAGNGDVPPPINLATKPTFPSAAAATGMTTATTAKSAELSGKDRKFDLELSSLWFMADARQLQLPPDFKGLNWTFSGSTSGDSHTINIAVRIPQDLSIVKFQLTWLQSNPLQTVHVQRNDIPPPRDLSGAELLEANNEFGDKVASWAESKHSQQVGDGECWTLAKYAIDQGTNGQAMSPQGYTHGCLIYHINNGSTPLVYKDDIRRGDIIQYTTVVFETKNDSGRVINKSSYGNPNHTAVVSSADKSSISLVHQNVGGVKRVQPGSQKFSDLISGDIKVYRVVWNSWAGELTV